MMNSIDKTADDALYQRIATLEQSLQGSRTTQTNVKLSNSIASGDLSLTGALQSISGLSSTMTPTDASIIYCYIATVMVQFKGGVGTFSDKVGIKFYGAGVDSLAQEYYTTMSASGTYHTLTATHMGATSGTQTITVKAYNLTASRGTVIAGDPTIQPTKLFVAYFGIYQA